MELQWVKAFVKATEGLFNTILSVEARAGAPRIKTELFPSFDVSGIIGLSGLAQGSVSISFPRETALKAVSVMVGATTTEIDLDMCDAVGEIANIIAGNAKRDLMELNLLISLPQVVVGKGHVLLGRSSVPATLVPFTTPFGDFILELCLQKA